MIKKNIKVLIMKKYVPNYLLFVGGYEDVDANPEFVINKSLPMSQRIAAASKLPRQQWAGIFVRVLELLAQSGNSVVAQMGQPEDGGEKFKLMYKPDAVHREWMEEEIELLLHQFYENVIAGKAVHPDIPQNQYGYFEVESGGAVEITGFGQISNFVEKTLSKLDQMERDLDYSFFPLFVEDYAKLLLPGAEEIKTLLATIENIEVGRIRMSYSVESQKQFRELAKKFRTTLKKTIDE